MELKTLTSALSAAVDEAVFDLECVEIADDGRSRQRSRQRVSSAELHEIYLREKDRRVDLYPKAAIGKATVMNAHVLEPGPGAQPEPDLVEVLQMPAPIRCRPSRLRNVGGRADTSGERFRTSTFVVSPVGQLN